MREKPPVALGTPIGLRELLEAAPDALFCCDSQGRFQWLNSAIEPLTGYPLVELLGHSFGNLVDDSSHRSMARFYLRQQRRRLPVTEHRWVLRARDGAGVPVSARVRRYERLDGEIAFVGCLRGQPHPAAPERERSPQPAASPAPRAPDHSHHDESGDVEARLRRLAEDLEAARAEARVKDELLRMLVHEIRTPVNGVLARTHLLLEGNQDAGQRDLLQSIHESSQALVTMANDAADFSLLQTGTCVIDTIDFDLRVTVGEAATMLAPFALDKGLRLESHVSHEAPSRLRGDPGRLRQVLFNLAAAAIRLGGPGVLRIAVERDKEEGQRVELGFSVACSNATVTQEQEALLRNIYGAGDLPEAGQLDGGALGLSIARNLVNRMGGEVGVDALADATLRLWFRVPLDKQPPAEAPAEAPEVQLRGLHMLVVDPAQNARQSSMEVLLAWGCRAEQVGAGEPALERLREAAAAGDAYRLTLVEMQLPDMDGLELAERVRVERTLDDTSLVLVATVGSRGDAARAQAAGVSAYLPKPVGWSELHDALNEVVRRGSGPAARSQPIVTRHSLADARRARVRILLADDDLVNQLVAKSVLSRSGFHVDVAGSGAEAIEACERQRYDLILMDSQMSDLDGYQTATALRARERGQHTPIVGMGGGARERSIEAGMDDHLVKPIDLAELCTLVEGWTVGAANWEPVAKAPDAEVARGKPEITAVIASSDPLPALDVARLEESCMGMEDLRESLLDAFLNDVRPRVDRLAEAIQAGDGRRLRFESHGLRGMCLTIGTAACARVFAELETMGREGRLFEARAMLQRAQTEVERAQRRIEAYREELRSAPEPRAAHDPESFGIRALPTEDDEPDDQVARAA